MLSDIIGPYYGIDWISTFLAMTGVYLIAEKKWIGFLVAILSNIGLLIFGSMANSIGTIFCGIGFAVINAWGIYSWEFRKKKK